MKKTPPNKKSAEQADAVDNYKIRTRLIHGSPRSSRWDYSHHVVPPMSSSATFRLSSTQRGAQGFFEFACDRIDAKRHVPIYIYDRLDEPTRGMLEENLALAEEGDVAVCFATGMAAITAAVNVLVRTGDEVLAHDTLYGCTYSYFTNWLPRMGVRATFTNFCDREKVAAAITAKTRVLYLETPVNPNMELIDLGGLRAVVDDANAGRAEEEKIRIVVDNTFATPFCQRPLRLGADIVVHSLTKGIGGFGTDMGGAVIAPEWLHNTLLLYRKDFGGVLSPKAAWNVLVYGLPSLATRMAAMQRNARYVAEYLEGHPKIERVAYPGLPSFPQYDLAQVQMFDYRGNFAPGSMIYFTLKNAGKKKDSGGKFIDYVADNAYCITLAVSLGQIKTLIENPYSMTHSSYLAGADAASLEHDKNERRTLEPGGIRLSIGLEDRDDILNDLEMALENA